MCVSLVGRQITPAAGNVDLRNRHRFLNEEGWRNSFVTL